MRHKSLIKIISPKQEINLRKLAAYLLTLPSNYPDFEMNNFVQLDDDESWEAEYAHLPGCGTAACAIGHGPDAGLRPKKDERWFEYSYRLFVKRPNTEDPGLNRLADRAWNWCFASEWSGVDNTVHGAAKRILWLLEHGLPEDHYAQRNGEADLCYLEMKEDA